MRKVVVAMRKVVIAMRTVVIAMCKVCMYVYPVVVMAYALLLPMIDNMVHVYGCGGTAGWSMLVGNVDKRR